MSTEPGSHSDVGTDVGTSVGDGDGSLVGDGVVGDGDGFGSVGLGVFVGSGVADGDDEGCCFVGECVGASMSRSTKNLI